MRPVCGLLLVDSIPDATWTVSVLVVLNALAAAAVPWEVMSGGL